MDDVEAKDIIIGALLSDASIAKSRVYYRYRRRKAVTTRGEMLNKKCVKHALYKSVFSISQTGVERIDWLFSIKAALLHEGVLVFPSNPRTTGLKVALVSSTHPMLSQLREEWYPDGHKEVPWEFGLSSVSLANMFMGDGCASFCRDGGVYVGLATQGFNEVSVRRLMHALHLVGVEDVGTSRCRHVKSTAGLGLTIGRRSQSRFMDLIEPHMLPSFAYKVKRQLNRK